MANLPFPPKFLSIAEGLLTHCEEGGLSIPELTANMRLIDLSLSALEAQEADTRPERQRFDYVRLYHEQLSAEGSEV